MDYIKTIDHDTCKIHMQGRFTFADHTEFKKLLSLVNEEAFKQLELDIENLEFVDSAALGLLLLLKDGTEKKNITFLIRKPQGQVEKMFRISRFYELFTIVA